MENARFTVGLFQTSGTLIRGHSNYTMVGCVRMEFCDSPEILEHWPRYWGCPHKDMATAIVRIQTQEGTVVAADGMECVRFTDKVFSMSAQKIFPVGSLPLAYSLYGTVGMPAKGTRRLAFHFGEEVEFAANVLQIERFEDIDLYVRCVGRVISERLRSLKSIGVIEYYPWTIEPGLPGATIAHIFFFGYFRGSPCTCDLRFFHRAQDLETPTVTFTEENPAVPIRIWGSKLVENALFYSNNKRLSPYRVSVPPPQEMSISQASDIAINYIRACDSDAGREIDPDACKGIGGHIHVAKMSPSFGFRWIKRPRKVTLQ